jgi:acetyl esterase/lipase
LVIVEGDTAVSSTTIRTFAVAALFLLAEAPARSGEGTKIRPDVVYGHKDGLALTFDVVTPAKANGAAILWIQSGGWYSSWVDSKVWPTRAKPFLDKGFTVLIVRHGSAPKYNIPEAVQDVRRSVRFVHMNAKELGIDADRLGVYGGSAGGHLSLVLATTGDDGDAKAKDELLRHSSRVTAVVAWYPPTDLREWVSNPPEEIKKHAGLKPPLSFDPKLAPGVSPVLHADSRNAAILMIHGDKDTLVPLEHSRNMLEALEKVKAVGKLMVVEGAAHDFSPKQFQDIVWPATVDWFEKHLAVKKAP